jgi:hypothetical protein
MTSYALLTPVPADHLRDGEDTCRRAGRVAFGSQAWPVFEELDLIAGSGIPVFIYASMDGGAVGPQVTWAATYQRYVESKGGAHPDRAKFRPRSCRSEDASGYWAGFYEVTDLRRLSDNEQI